MSKFIGSAVTAATRNRTRLPVMLGKRITTALGAAVLAAGLTVGTAPNASAQCGVDWINQQTCNNIMRQYMVGKDFDVYLSQLVEDLNDRAAVRDYLWHARI